MNWVSKRIDEGRKAPPWGYLLVQNFGKSYALFTETAILILNRHEQMIKILKVK